MSKKTNIDAFVEAYLLADYGRCEELLGGMSPEGEHYRYCSAIVAARNRAAVTQDPEGHAAGIEQLHRLLQERPPTHVGLFQITLMAASRLIMHGKAGDGVKSVRLLKELVGEDASPLLRANVLYCDSIVKFELGAFDAAFQAAECACQQRIPVCDFWYRLRIHLASMAMSATRLRCAESVLHEVCARAPANGGLRALLEDRQARLLVLRGKSREGLAFLDSIGPAATPDSVDRRLFYKVRLLLATGRTDEARAAIEAAGDQIPDHRREFMLARISLTLGDAGSARKQSRRSVSLAASSAWEGNTSLFVNDNARFLVPVELMDGKPELAKILLKAADPDSTRLGSAMAWACIHWAEGRKVEAARMFRRILDADDPLLLRENIRDATGMNGMQIAQLWTLAADLDPAAAAPAPAPAKPSAEGLSLADVLVGETPAVHRVRALVEQYAPLSETVLVTGETGTGKELVARLLHEKSPRAAQPFIAVNCASISELLIETELFGHVRGAFTGATSSSEGLFAAAGEGTIFLDEISSMSLRLQAALLRVLENGEIRPVGASRSRRVKARVVAASNQPLEELVERKEFRADLFYRLARLTIRIPPLRERTADVPLLVRHFLGQFTEHGQVALGDDLLGALAAHSWPGNVRELQNEIRRILLLRDSEPVLHAGLFVREPVTPQTGPVDVPAQAGPIRPPRGRDRLDALREFFAQRKKLTRAEIISLLHCAPNTATAYLKALEKEGLIRRVCPSGWLRASYFVLAEPAAR